MLSFYSYRIALIFVELVCALYVVLADAHFPTSSVCQCGPREIRADGVFYCVCFDDVNL